MNALQIALFLLAGTFGQADLLRFCLLAAILNGAPTEGFEKMSNWRIRRRDADGRDAEATQLCREAAMVQALFLERRQHCRVKIIEGPGGQLIDRETLRARAPKENALVSAFLLRLCERREAFGLVAFDQVL